MTYTNKFYVGMLAVLATQKIQAEAAFSSPENMLSKICDLYTEMVHTSRIDKF
jgi:hypothetical protein